MASVSLDSLAPEIISNIVSHAADINDIKNIRLTNKTLSEHAVRELFREAFIRLDEESITRWDRISGCAPLAQLARRAVIHTVEDVTEDDRWACPEVTEEAEEGFQKAVSALSKFPNLDSLLVAFSIPCGGLDDPDIDDDELMEPVKVRLERLQLIFNAIKTRQDVGKTRIGSLTLVNLQNQPIPDFTGSELFHDVMSQLDEFHVQIVQESNEHGPDHDYDKIELQTFPAHFCSAWLAPIAANLRELSLYSESEKWGPFPGYFDPSGISFPKLETLSLGSYVIAYDDQLDWIMSIKSLKKLVMHRCMIASHLRIARENVEAWKPRTRYWVELETGPEEWSAAYTYGQTWGVIFEALAAKLPNLQRFVFDYPCREYDMRRAGYPEDRREYGVEGRHDMSSSLYPQRYVVFDNGLLPSHWLRTSHDGKMSWDYGKEGETPNMHEQHFESDQVALDNLLKLCRTRQ